MAQPQQTKNDIAWEELFKKYNIKEEINRNSYFLINSSQINEFRQARLMTKFDNSKTLPKLFKNNRLSILPISGTSYIIGNFELYENIGEINTPIQFMEFPSNIESIDCNKINSETIALNCAYISKILEDFLDEKSKKMGLIPTVAGKMSSGQFEFNVNNKRGDTYKISVDRTGIEIDAGYETDTSLILIEAKNVIADDFLVRQLYYLYRLWKEKINKKVRTVFMQYNNGVFNLYEYEFKDPKNYNSLQLKKSKRYSLVSPEQMMITEQDILNIVKNIKIIDEPEVPFPQANSFNRVISLLEMLNTDVIKSKEEITTEFEFDPRQTDYYFNAGKYLGFLEETKTTVNDNGKNIEKPAIILTTRGKKLFDISYKGRQLEYIKAILEHKVFNQVFYEYTNNNKNIDNNKLIKIMEDSNLYNLNSLVTLKRRASTIQRWVEWILNLIEVNK